jgi:hypothetical protein
VRGVDLGQLIGAEPDRAREQLLEDRALAELDQPAHDRVHHRDLLQRCGGGSIRRMLIRLGRDVLEALVFGQVHQVKVVGP